MSLFRSLSIGHRSLSAAQMKQSTAGHNVSNMDTEGFSRQDVNQASAQPGSNGLGGGVRATGVRRIHNQFTQKKLIDENNIVGKLDVRKQSLRDVEIVFTDLEQNGLRNALDEFWTSWATVANQPEEAILRTNVVSKSQQLVERFQVVNHQLSKIRNDLNTNLKAKMLKVNEMAKGIASSNKEIQQLEISGDTTANDFRDQRDLLIQDLSSIIDINWYENKRGLVKISIGNGQLLVDGRDANLLIPVANEKEVKMANVAIRLKSGITHDISNDIRGGKIRELLDQRDKTSKKYQDDLNLLAREIAFNVNKIHSKGTGLGSSRSEEVSAYRLNKSTLQDPVPLLKDGNLTIKVLGKEDQLFKEVTVSLSSKDNLKTIAEKINMSADAYLKDLNGKLIMDKEGNKIFKEEPILKAMVNDDGSFGLKTGFSRKFIYGSDETDFLPLLGLNSFFHVVSGSTDLRINPEMKENELMLATGYDLVSGDNRVALEIAELQHTPKMLDGKITFDEYYNSQVADIGLKMQKAEKEYENHFAILSQFKALRDSVSSVNMDEEIANMAMFQKSYEASARFISTIDEMSETLINM